MRREHSDNGDEIRKPEREGPVFGEGHFVDHENGHANRKTDTGLEHHQERVLDVLSCFLVFSGAGDDEKDETDA